MEKCAFVFLRSWLEIILASSAAFALLSLLGKTSGGIEGLLKILLLRESLTYILLGLALSVGGGCFIDFIIKRENK